MAPPGTGAATGPPLRERPWALAASQRANSVSIVGAWGHRWDTEGTGTQAGCPGGHALSSRRAEWPPPGESGRHPPPNPLRQPRLSGPSEDKIFPLGVWAFPQPRPLPVICSNLLNYPGGLSGGENRSTSCSPPPHPTRPDKANLAWM